MVPVAAGEPFSFLALSALPNEGPILIAWRPGAGIHETELLELAMDGGIRRRDNPNDFGRPLGHKG